MKITLRETYNCSHCNKLYLRKQSALTHEHLCFKNPANDALCYTCKHFEKKQVEAEYINYGVRSTSYKPLLMFCNKLAICLHPLQYDRVAQTIEFDNEPVRKECESYKKTVFIEGATNENQ